jgi:long-chain acyl-CoA synthetase
VQTETGTSRVGDPYEERPWLQQYPPDVVRALPYPEQSVWDALEDTVAQYGDHDALIFQNYPMTYARVMNEAGRMSEALANAGVAKGDVVLLLLPNTPHFVITYYAVLRLGAVVAAAPPNSVGPEVEYFLADSGAKTIVTIDLLYEKIATVWESAGVKNVIVGQVTDFMPLYVRLVAPFSSRVPKPKTPVPYGPTVRHMRRFLTSGNHASARTDVGPTDVALLQYTGGTTGTPKAAMLTHRNLLVNALQMRVWFPSLRDGEETILAVIPFSHIYGLTLALNAGMLIAARTVLIAGGWSPSEIFDSIRRYRPTVFPGVPTLYVAIVNDARSRTHDLSSINICASGGAPLPVEVKRDFEELTGGHLYEAYGLTEASPLVSAQPYVGGKIGSIGLPVPDTDIQLVDPDSGGIASVGEAGELLVQGPQVMKGYWNRPEETAEVLRDGWLHTGDIARMDGDGALYIVERIKDLIITGGENIYPREVEEVLFTHPKVQEAAVVGVPHPFGGEIAKAYIVLKSGEMANKRDITDFARERLAKSKVPRAVEFREELPKSSAGKVLRRVLAEEERERAKRHPRRPRSEEQPSS